MCKYIIYIQCVTQQNKSNTLIQYYKLRQNSTVEFCVEKNEQQRRKKTTCWHHVFLTDYVLDSLINCSMCVFTFPCYTIQCIYASIRQLCVCFCCLTEIFCRNFCQEIRVLILILHSHKDSKLNSNAGAS